MSVEALRIAPHCENEKSRIRKICRDVSKPACAMLGASGRNNEEKNREQEQRATTWPRGRPSGSSKETGSSFMITRIRRALAALFTVLVFGTPSVAPAVAITFRSIDLVDLVAGQDLWRYEYSVSGSFVAFGGFNVLFSPNLYSNLENPPPPVNSD